MQNVKSYILRDVMGVCVIMALTFLFALGINTLRSKPLPWIYVSPQKRLANQINQLRVVAKDPPISVLDKDVSLDEMKRISAYSTYAILDARPEIFYKLSHIPSARSLPRDDFARHYRDLESTLIPYRDKELVVYCSGDDCEDSQMVADALRKLGYSHVRVFRGGWDDWDAAQLPEEKSNE